MCCFIASTSHSVLAFKYIAKEVSSPPLAAESLRLAQKKVSTRFLRAIEKICCQVWWHMPLILVLGGKGRHTFKFKARKLQSKTLPVSKKNQKTNKQ